MNKLFYKTEHGAVRYSSCIDSLHYHDMHPHFAQVLNIVRRVSIYTVLIALTTKNPCL